MKNTDVLIIGAGLAGLSLAYHLDRDYLVIEKETEPGGKCRTIRSGESFYDYTGHLLHLRKPEMKALVTKLLQGRLREIERKAGIFTHERFLPFPFQANFHPLPRQVVKECLLGFVNAWKKEEPTSRLASFKEWALKTFGEGICEYFLYPYNEKLYRTKPGSMSSDWVSWSVPQPDIETVIDGALGTEAEGLGYNARFLYPVEGGIDILPRSLAAGIENIQYSETVTAIDPAKKVATSSSGETYGFEKLVSTMPLPELLGVIRTDENKLIQHFLEDLRWVNVYNINFTLDTVPDWDWQWLYLPEKEFRCYRVGVSSNITPSLAPKGCCTIYTEVSYLPEDQIDPETLRDEVLRDLERLGLLRKGVKVVDEAVVDLDHAYVVHDRNRMENLDSILEWLDPFDIISTGRWGAWVYGGMEDAMWQGCELAKKMNQSR